MNMKFMSILFTEGRKEDLKKKYASKFSEEELDFILGISDLQDFNHKYTDWVLKNLNHEGSDLEEWVENAVGLVKDFDKYQKNLEKKDINQYSNFGELARALVPSSMKEQERILESQTEKIYEDDDFLVLVPKTEAASCKYGAGTKWCVTQRGGGHFERYTGNNQGLYFILRKKGDQKQPHYKVAVHIDNQGNESWWDAQDNRMNREAVTLIKDYFPKVYDSIITNYKETKRSDKSNITQAFDIWDRRTLGQDNFLNTNKNLSIFLNGYQNIHDMPGHAEGNVRIYFDGTILDEYTVMITYKMNDVNYEQWTMDVGFSETGADFNPTVELDLIGNGFKRQFSITHDSKVIWEEVSSSIVRYVYQTIRDNKNLITYVTGHLAVWRPDRANYGYTFGKNAGLVKKLVDWVDTGKIGTKLDFLVDIGKLIGRTIDGKKQYSRTGEGSFKFSPANRWRGHFSSFFASAKMAGIIDYRKVGRDFFIKKGPNFEAFKEGKLKAL